MASSPKPRRYLSRFATLRINKTIQLLTKLGWTKQLNAMEDYGTIDHAGCIGTSTLFYSGLVVKRDTTASCVAGNESNCPSGLEQHVVVETTTSGWRPEILPLN